MSELDVVVFHLAVIDVFPSSDDHQGALVVIIDWHCEVVVDAEKAEVLEEVECLVSGVGERIGLALVDESVMHFCLFELHKKAVPQRINIMPVTDLHVVWSSPQLTLVKLVGIRVV
jgi:hypothetical protein